MASNQKQDLKLNRERRILSRKDFLRIQEKGTKQKSKNLLIAYNLVEGAEDAPFGDSRLGVTVSTKISKKSVLRNKVKRRVKELFRYSRRYFIQHGEIVVIARDGILNLSYKQLRSEFIYLLIRGGFIKPRAEKRED